MFVWMLSCRCCCVSPLWFECTGCNRECVTTTLSSAEKTQTLHSEKPWAGKSSNRQTWSGVIASPQKHSHFFTTTLTSSVWREESETNMIDSLDGYSYLSDVPFTVIHNGHMDLLSNETCNIGTMLRPVDRGKREIFAALQIFWICY